MNEFPRDFLFLIVAIIYLSLNTQIIPATFFQFLLSFKRCFLLTLADIHAYILSRDFNIFYRLQIGLRQVVQKSMKLQNTFLNSEIF